MKKVKEKDPKSAKFLYTQVWQTPINKL